MNTLTIKNAATGATCGLACWWAEQETCRCSCGGRAHGILAMGGTQPRRNCLILGHRYVLGAVNGSWSAINEWAHGVGPHEKPPMPAYAIGPRRNERGAIWWSKAASDSQIRWPELAGFAPVNRWDPKPSLEWIREDWSDAFDAWLNS